MNREKIAKELIAVARELVGKRSFNYDFSKWKNELERALQDAIMSRNPKAVLDWIYLRASGTATGNQYTDYRAFKVVDAEADNWTTYLEGFKPVPVQMLLEVFFKKYAQMPKGESIRSLMKNKSVMQKLQRVLPSFEIEIPGEKAGDIDGEITWSTNKGEGESAIHWGDLEFDEIFVYVKPVLRGNVIHLDTEIPDEKEMMDEIAWNYAKQSEGDNA